MHASARGLRSGLISPLTAVGENPTLEVHVEGAEKHFMHRDGPELEFSARPCLLSLDFYPNAALLCRYLMFARGKVVEIKFCRTTVGAGRLYVKGRNRTGHP